MNKRHSYIPIGMSSHMSNSVFPIIGARFAVEKKSHCKIRQEDSISRLFFLNIQILTVS